MTDFFNSRRPTTELHSERHIDDAAQSLRHCLAMRYYDTLFCGTYVHFLETDNGGRPEISGYFAYTSLLALVFLNYLLVISASLLLGEWTYPFFMTAWGPALVGILLFAANYALFIRKSRYVEIVRAHLESAKPRSKAPEKTLFRSVVIVFIMFLASVIFTVSRW